MGIQDREYMRERTRARAAQSGSRRRSRKTNLESWLGAPFKNQKAALAIAAFGLVLISKIPATIITTIFSAPDETSPTGLTTGMFIRVFAGAGLQLTPLLRIFGIALVLAAGIALISKRKRWGYCTIIKDPTLSALTGGALISVICWSILTQGLWLNQTKEAVSESAELIIGPNQALQQPQPAILGTPTSVPSYSNLPKQDLVPDRPFPANGTFERMLPLQGKIARMDFVNLSRNNIIVIWHYNLQQGQGDQEALRLYLTAGQSGSVDLPAFDYRIALYEADPSLGLDRGFGPDARMKDLGLVDLKTEAQSLSKQPSGTYHGFSIYNHKAGTFAVAK